MADDEQFSLCWNNFNTNLSAGFHESLCRGDLVDVTLAAEGQMVKAHRLVLSVCSPYFRKMFTQMPANQHAFVFLKDVSHSALKDLIQFMYCGEVNVKHDALPAFISTAEALQIKGLTETAEANNTASPAKAPTPAPSASSTTSPRSRAQRNISRTSYKLESEDSNDERPIIVPTQKRGAQRSVTPQSAPAVKRIKSIDPLEAAEPIQETVTPDKSEEPEFIDLPIESIPTKSEPEYAEDSAEVESAEQDASYVEDDSYGDMKYDESYFTENDDSGKPGVSGFSESYTTEGDQSATEAQETPKQLKFLKSPWATPCLIVDGYMYNCHSTRGDKGYWRCHNYSKRKVELRCRARCVVKDGQVKAFTGGGHNHLPHTEKIEKITKRNSMIQHVPIKSAIQDLPIIATIESMSSDNYKYYNN